MTLSPVETSSRRRLLSRLPSLLAALPLFLGSGCQPDPYLLLQLDAVPEEARSVQILYQRGLQPGSLLPAIDLPPARTAGLSLRFDLPSGTQDEIEVSVGAYSGASASGCLIAEGSARSVPSGTLRVPFRPIVVPGQDCVAGDVVVLGASPSLLSTAQAVQSEIVLSGWGFQPSTEVAIDGVPVAQQTFVSNSTLRVVPSQPWRSGAVDVRVRNGGQPFVRSDLLRFWATQLSYQVTEQPWDEYRLPKSSDPILATTLLRYLSSDPRLAILRKTADGPAAYDLMATIPYSKAPPRGGLAQRADSLFGGTGLNGPSQVLRAQLDVYPGDDAIVIDSRPRDADGILYKLAVRSQIAPSPDYHACNNLQSKPLNTMRMTSVLTVPRTISSPISTDIWVAYENNTIGILRGDPRGLFNYRTPGVCDSINFAQPYKSIDGMWLYNSGLVDHVLVLANDRSTLAVAYPTGFSYSNPNGGMIILYQGTPLFESKLGPFQYVLHEDINQDSVPDLGLVYTQNGQTILELHMNTTQNGILSYSQPGVIIPFGFECGAEMHMRTGDINDDGFLDIIIGCNHDALHISTVEAVLSQGQAGVFASKPQSIPASFPQGKGSPLFFEALYLNDLSRLSLIVVTPEAPYLLTNHNR